MSYEKIPNERIVKINKERVEKASGKAFACIYKDNITNACCDLKPSTFKIWVYLASNKINYELPYSPAYLSKVINVSIKTAKNGFTELQEKGYIIEDLERKNHYVFYEKPQEREEIKEIVNPYTGEILHLTYQQTVGLFGYITGISLWGGNQYED